MRRRLAALLLLVVFLLSATVTVAFADPPPKCLKCNNAGCPEGLYCWVDCVGCCYMHPMYPWPVCFR